MIGQQQSGVRRLNRHYQSGGKKHEYKFNPFSGFAAPAGWQPMASTPLTYSSHDVYSTRDIFHCKGAANQYLAFYGINGCYVAGDPVTTLIQRVQNAFAATPKLYGHIHISLKTSAASDLTFYWISRYNGEDDDTGLLTDTTTAPISFRVSNASGGSTSHALIPSGYAVDEDGNRGEYKIAGTRITFTISGLSTTQYSGYSLNDGFDIYVKLPNVENVIFSLFSPNTTIAGRIIDMMISSNRQMTSAEIDYLRENQDTFVITTRAEAISQAVYDGIVV